MSESEDRGTEGGVSLDSDFLSYRNGTYHCPQDNPYFRRVTYILRPLSLSDLCLTQLRTETESDQYTSWWRGLGSKRVDVLTLWLVGVSKQSTVIYYWFTPGSTLGCIFSENYLLSRLYPHPNNVRLFCKVPSHPSTVPSKRPPSLRQT